MHTKIAVKRGLLFFFGNEWIFTREKIKNLEPFWIFCGKKIMLAQCSPVVYWCGNIVCSTMIVLLREKGCVFLNGFFPSRFISISKTRGIASLTLPPVMSAVCFLPKTFYLPISQLNDIIALLLWNRIRCLRRNNIFFFRNF